jgi:hypothetical protein
MINRTDNPLHFYPILAMQSLDHLFIHNSSVSHFVLHHLLSALTRIDMLTLFNCPNANISELRASFPRVCIEEEF